MEKVSLVTLPYDLLATLEIPRYWGVLIAGDELKRGVKDLWNYVSHLSIHTRALKALIKTAVLKGAEKFKIVLKKE